MFEHSWKITVPISIVVIFGFGITAYALTNQDNCQIRLLVELQDLLKIETEIDRRQCK